jgi:hypothetical protein
MDEHHLATKMKNRRVVVEICKKETNVDRLMREFESIMEYYFSKRDEVASKSKEELWAYEAEGR